MAAYLSNQIKTTRNTFRDPIIATVSVGMVLALFVFVVWPLLNVVKQSFTDLDDNFSLQAYINIVTMSETYQALVNTLMLAIIVGVLATSVGFLFAYCSSHLAIRGKKLFNPGRRCHDQERAPEGSRQEVHRLVPDEEGPGNRPEQQLLSVPDQSGSQPPKEALAFKDAKLLKYDFQWSGDNRARLLEAWNKAVKK